jgi:hypothetical protein
MTAQLRLLSCNTESWFAEIARCAHSGSIVSLPGIPVPTRRAAVGHRTVEVSRRAIGGSLVYGMTNAFIAAPPSRRIGLPSVHCHAMLVHMRGTKFKPKWSEPCLCGSGKKYKECCWRRLPRFDIGKDYTRAVNDRNYEKALMAARADVVQYTIWHKSHTEPGLGFDAPIHELLKIDVNALAVMSTVYCGFMSA